MKVFENATQPNDERVIMLDSVEYSVLTLGMKYLSEGSAFTSQENRDDAGRMADTLDKKGKS